MKGYCLSAVALTSLGLTLAAAPATLVPGPAAHFIAHTVATELTGGYQVVVVDLNHDGKPD